MVGPGVQMYWARRFAPGGVQEAEPLLLQESWPAWEDLALGVALCMCGPQVLPEEPVGGRWNISRMVKAGIFVLGVVALARAATRSLEELSRSMQPTLPGALGTIVGVLVTTSA